MALDKSIVTSEKEIAALKVKFDADKRRWLALKGIQGKILDAPSAAAAKTDLPKR